MFREFPLCGAETFELTPSPLELGWLLFVSRFLDRSSPPARDTLPPFNHPFFGVCLSSAFLSVGPYGKIFTARPRLLPLFYRCYFPNPPPSRNGLLPLSVDGEILLADQPSLFPSISLHPFTGGVGVVPSDAAPPHDIRWLTSPFFNWYCVLCSPGGEIS